MIKWHDNNYHYYYSIILVWGKFKEVVIFILKALSNVSTAVAVAVPDSITETNQNVKVEQQEKETRINYKYY